MTEVERKNFARKSWTKEGDNMTVSQRADSLTDAIDQEINYWWGRNLTPSKFVIEAA